METTTINEKTTPSEHIPNPQKKHALKYLLLLLVAVVVIIIIAVVLLRGYTPSEPYYTISGYRYKVVYTTHTPTGNTTITNYENSTTWTLRYTLDSQIFINQQFYNNVPIGTTSVSNITCETPGFNFVSSAQPFPFTIPTALNASVNNNNIIVRLTFGTPSEPYTGPFIYTAYFDYYPLG